MLTWIFVAMILVSDFVASQPQSLPKRAATTDSPLFNAVRRRNLTTENSHQSIVDLFDTKSPVAQKLQEGSNTLKSDATSHAAKDKAVQKLQQACDYYSSDDLMFNIQNGELANATEFPWMAGLGYLDPNSDTVKYKCAGTIISDTFILTAAHCVEENNSPIRVRIGTPNVFDPNGENFQIQEIIQHPNFSKEYAKNDIALIRLRRKIQFAANKRPACLETDTNDLSSIFGLNITGWGGSSTQYASIDLLKAEVVTMPLSQCSDFFLNYNKKAHSATLRDGIIESQYCAHDPIKKSASCRGDSGGPLQFFRSEHIAHVVAISSFGIPCGRGYPSVYTRVAFYANWITDHVWPDA